MLTCRCQLLQFDHVAVRVAPVGRADSEVEVLRLVTSGRTAVETGRALGISAHTVRRHIANVTDKAGVRGRVALTRYALEHHLVQDEG